MKYYVGTELYSGDALQHYGVKGMKWGVRKADNNSPNGIRSRFRKRFRPTHEDLLKSKNPKQLYKHRDELSDYELKKKVDRLYNEKKLKDLYDSPQAKRQQKKGQAIANDIVKKTATTVVASVATAAALYSAKNLMDKYYPGMSDFLTFKR